MSNKKKMAFVDLTNYLDWPMGGMLEYELAILNHLVNIYDVDIWGITVDGKVNKTVVINEKIYPIHIWGNAKTKKKVIPNYWRGLSIISQKKNFPQDYDVVYAHTGSCLVALCKMVDRKKTKLVYHQHGLNHRADYSMMSLIQRPLLNKALRIADLIFVVSNPESVKEYAKEMKYKTNAKFISIGSPINLDRFDEAVVKSRIAERSNFKITSFLYTGRLTIFKNARTLIEAMNRYVNEVNKEAILKIAGTGEEMKVMKKQIQTYGLEKNVQLLGAVPHEEVYDLLRESDVFVTASGGEGVSV
ncbi:MAG: glycosyltransferase family 4 protein, partial [Clostridiaceae bacterium]